MHIVLTQFATDRHFDPDSAGTVITDCTPEEFVKEIHKRQAIFRHGYAPFCKLLFYPNWTDASAGTLPITPENEKFLKSEYKARREDELPVLVRWLELCEVPRALWLCVVVYDREQLLKEGTDIGDADCGIVAILGQMHDREEPMTSMTAMRNALGVEEGGSDVPLDHEAYLRSVEFWNAHAAVKLTPTTLKKAISEREALAAALDQLDERIVKFVRSTTDDRSGLCVIDGDVYGVVTMNDRSYLHRAHHPDLCGSRETYPVVDGEQAI